MLCSATRARARRRRAAASSRSRPTRRSATRCARCSARPTSCSRSTCRYNRPDLLCVSGMARELAAAFGVAAGRAAPGALRRDRRGRRRVPRHGRGSGRLRALPGAGRPRRDRRAVAARGSPSASSARACAPSTTSSTSRTTSCSRWASRCTPSTSTRSTARRSSCAAPAPARCSPRSTASERKLTPEHLVIADRDARHGARRHHGRRVRGGDARARTNLLLEAAWFDPVRVQRMVSDFGLMSEAARRFGRGVDPASRRPRWRARWRCSRELAGGTLDGAATDVTARAVRAARARAAPGPRHAAPRRARSRATRMVEGPRGLGPRGDRGVGGGRLGDAALIVTVPTRRRDLTAEVDLIEEVGARRSATIACPRRRWRPAARSGDAPGRAPPAGPRARRARRARLHRVPHAVARRPGAAGSNVAAVARRRGRRPRRSRTRRARRPRALRSDLVCGLLRVAAHNLRHGARGLRLFEVGRVLRPAGGQGAPDETAEVAALVTGRRFRRRVGRRTGGDRLLRGEGFVGGARRASRR